MAQRSIGFWVGRTAGAERRTERAVPRQSWPSGLRAALAAQRSARDVRPRAVRIGRSADVQNPAAALCLSRRALRRPFPRFSP
ncbi:hypothetical protein BURMUCF2_3217 [Burkholderia multivorans CF2]|nr:hypothetical protein BURMUCF2_3217 [Burkholderia multivorans CF2]